jgi:hypothetical protein
MPSLAGRPSTVRAYRSICAASAAASIEAGRISSRQRRDQRHALRPVAFMLVDELLRQQPFDQLRMALRRHAADLQIGAGGNLDEPLPCLAASAAIRCNCTGVSVAPGGCSRTSQPSPVSIGFERARAPAASQCFL